MDPVYEKLALQIAQLTLDKAVLEVELNKARTELAEDAADVKNEGE